MLSVDFLVRNLKEQKIVGSRMLYSKHLMGKKSVKCTLPGKAVF